MNGVETIGQAFSLNWRLHAACAFGNRDGMKTIRPCVWRHELDMMTLVATRGRNYPLATLPRRLRCPRCGSDRMRIWFEPPSTSNAIRAAE